MSNEEKLSVDLAIAINDIVWIKGTMENMNEGIKALQHSVDSLLQTQDVKYAKIEDLESLRQDVESLKKWRWRIGGALILAGILIGYAAEILRSLN